jgi:hypothetical protein
MEVRRCTRELRRRRPSSSNTHHVTFGAIPQHTDAILARVAEPNSMIQPLVFVHHPGVQLLGSQFSRWEPEPSMN